MIFQHLKHAALAATAAALFLTPAGQAQTVSGQWTGLMERAAEAYEGERTAVHFRNDLALHWSMFTAANTVNPQYRSPIAIEPYEGDPDLAAALAAADIIERLYGEVVDTEIGERLEVRRSGLDIETIKASQAAAVAAVEAVWERLDRERRPNPPYRPFTIAGVYVPTGDPVGLGAIVGEPLVLDARDELFPEGPPPLDSDAWARDYIVVQAIGAGLR